MSKPVTLSMFPAGEDLPLFSRCPQTVRLVHFTPRPITVQLDLIPPRCNICKDAGSVAGKRCWCQTEEEVT